MSNYGPWSVKGIDQRAREAAREAAREEGLTIGEYINRMLLEETEEDAPSIRDYREPRYPRAVEEVPPAPRRPQQGRGTFDQLIARLEAVEARSTLALTGIDQSIVGLVARLNKTDAKSDRVAENVDAFIEDLRTTYEQLQEKVEALEEDDTGARNLESLKSLEKALGELASHINEQNERRKNENQDIRGQVKSDLEDVKSRVSGMEKRVESTLADTSRRIEETLEQAEAWSEKSSRKLDERVSEVESAVASKLSRLDQFDERMGAVEGDVAGALSSIEAVMTRMQDRLHRAETATNTAIEGLEQTFNRLDQRINELAEHASPEAAAELKAQFESRFEGLAGELRSSVESARESLAREIEEAAASADPEKLGALEESVDGLQKRVAASEERSSRALEGMTNQVSRISTSLDRRLREVEARDPGEAVETVRADMEKLTQEVSDRFEQFDSQNDEVINKITEQMQALADQFESRVDESEQRSANAIEQVGEQVANVAQRLQARQERAFTQLQESMEQARKQQSMRLSDALTGVSDRIEKMQQQQASAMSPVQKAIASLATRLEALEDFTAPPHAQPARAGSEPDFPGPDYDGFADEQDTSNDLTFDEEGHEPSDLEMLVAEIEDEAPAAEADAGDDIFEIEIDESGFEDDEDAAFEAGIPDISEVDEPSDAVETESDLLETLEIDDGDEPIEIADPDADPLSELSAWDDGADEARDSDIFGEDDPSDLLEAGEDGESETDLDADEEALADAEEEAPLQEDPEAMDYLSRARKAAMSATAESRRGKVNTGKRGKSRVPLVAAVSVIALATAAAGTFVTLRGLQQDADRPVVQSTTPVHAEPTSADAAPDETSAPEETAAAPVIEPLDSSELASLSPEEAAAIESELFEEPADSPAPQALQPVVDYAALPRIPQTPTLESAASTGDPVAQLILGEQRLDAGDYTSGPSLVRWAAEAGEPAAQYRLAKLHERGLGVPKDLEAARQWTERAAEGGNVKAMHDLAVYYAEGEGGQQSYAAAAEWFRKAADYGLTDSQYNLAVLYEAGLGISPSRTEALYWYEVANAQGDSGAIEKVEELRAGLSLDAAQQAQRRAASWSSAEPSARPNGRFGLQAWQGSSAEQVRSVQTVLGALGYEAGPADGVMGAGTSSAIAAYQRDAGLPATGSITPELVSSLNNTVEGASQGG